MPVRPHPAREALPRIGRLTCAARATRLLLCAPHPCVQVATDVGFYYMANAAGRLLGTILSGALYSYAAATPALGFAACMFTSSGFCLLSGAIVFLCRDDEDGLRCGRIACMGGKGGKPKEIAEVA